MELKENTGIVIIILLFIGANIAFLNFYDNVWWDSSVYIGMGKHIYSSGNSGLWESSRPLIMPLILGLGWKLGIDPVLFGRTVSILFSAAVILMVYLIGMKLFSKKTALLASFFTAFSFNFIFFSPNILTEIPSTFFLLAAFYFFIEERFFLVGLFSGFAIITRFFQVFVLIGLTLAFFFYFCRKPDFWRKLAFASLGALAIIMPYLFLNYIMYNDVLLPLKVQTHLTNTTGWTNYQEYGFYFTGLFRENFMLMALLALPFFFRKDHKFHALAFASFLYLIIFSIVKHKEMRFMLLILPFLYLLLAFCLMEINQKIKNSKIATALFIIMAAAWLLTTFASFKDILHYSQQRGDQGLVYFQEYLKTGKGVIWVTNPLYALQSNSRIDTLLYYYSTDNLINFLNNNPNKADIVMYNSCDIPCNPTGIDPRCDESRNLLNDVLSKFENVYEKELHGCS